jgi:trimeric autotransporter adhesin
VPTPIAALNASINPTILTTDRAGNTYFTNQIGGAAVYKLATSGIVTRVAGTGRPVVPNTISAVASTSLSAVAGIAADQAGNVYISDGYFIRKVSPTGVFTTIAGTGAPFSGDGGPATAAGLTPQGLDFDSAGNLYIADSFRIRKISTDGIIQTIAGNGAAGYSGDGGSALSASLSAFPIAELAVDPTGNVYFVAIPETKIRKVSVNGTITTIAGSGAHGTAGDGAPAINAQFESPAGLIADAVGNLLIADDWRIRKVSPNGVINTVYGTSLGYSGDGGPASAAEFYNIRGMHLDGGGNLFLADAGNNRVREISAPGIVTTVGGDGFASYSGDGGPALSAQIDAAFSVALDSSGNLYIGDILNYSVRKVTPDGIITGFAGNGMAGTAVDGQPAATSQIGAVGGVAVDNSGVVYISDVYNDCVWKVTTDGLIHRVAGGLSRGYSGDGGPALNAGLVTPWGLTFDSAGNLYIADENDSRIRKVSPAGIISTVAGNGSKSFSGDGGLATSAALNTPQTVAVDATGNVFIADYANGRIRKVSANGIISTVAGNGATSISYTQSDGDGGPATNAWLGEPYGVAVDQAGNLYISGTTAIRKVLPDGIIGSIAGDFPPLGGYEEGGPATAFSLSAEGLAIAGNGNIYLADTSDNTIRVLQPVSALAVVNAASNVSSSVSPGEIVVLYGSNLGPAQLVSAALGPDGLYDARLAATTVSFNGIPASLIYTSANQVAAIVPYEVLAATAEVTVGYQGQTAAASVFVAASAPGIFTLNASGKGQAAALNQDTSINGPSAPAKTGDVISLYLTGEGQTSPGGVDGKPGAAPYPKPNLPVIATIGGQPAMVEYAGGASGEVAGVMQLNVQIPAGVQSSDAVPVIVQIGGASSQPGLTIAVR